MTVGKLVWLALIGVLACVIIVAVMQPSPW
jgi:hypothetical protein